MSTFLPSYIQENCMKEYVQNYYKTKDKCVWEMAKKNAQIWTKCHIFGFEFWPRTLRIFDWRYLQQRAPSLVLFTPLDRSLPPTTSSLGSIRGIKFKLVNFKLPSMALIWAPLCHFQLKGHKICILIIYSYTHSIIAT